MEKEKYLELVKTNVPKSPMMRTLIASFIVGGLICCLGQLIFDIFKMSIPTLSKVQLSTITSMIMIFLGSLFTALGLYDKLGHYAGAGSIIPITGFANSLVSPAMEYNREGIVLGICAKMFVIVGPIIVFGVVASIIVGIIALFL